MIITNSNLNDIDMETLQGLLKEVKDERKIGKIFRENFMTMDDVILEMGDIVTSDFSDDYDLGKYLKDYSYIVMRKFL